MKKIVFVFLFSMSFQVNAQWFWQNPLPHSGLFTSNVFINDSTEIIVGSESVIIKTTDWGQTWQRKNLGSYANLVKVKFFNNDGWMLSTNGQLFGSTDGGNNWYLQNDLSSNTTYDMDFTSCYSG